MEAIIPEKFIRMCELLEIRTYPCHWRFEEKDHQIVVTFIWNVGVSEVLSPKPVTMKSQPTKPATFDNSVPNHETTNNKKQLDEDKAARIESGKENTTNMDDKKEKSDKAVVPGRAAEHKHTSSKEKPKAQKSESKQCEGKHFTSNSEKRHKSSKSEGEREKSKTDDNIEKCAKDRGSKSMKSHSESSSPRIKRHSGDSISENSNKTASLKSENSANEKKRSTVSSSHSRKKHLSNSHRKQSVVTSSTDKTSDDINSDNENNEQVTSSSNESRQDGNSSFESSRVDSTVQSSKTFHGASGSISSTGSDKLHASSTKSSEHKCKYISSNKQRQRHSCSSKEKKQSSASSVRDKRHPSSSGRKHDSDYSSSKHKLCISEISPNKPVDSSVYGPVKSENIEVIPSKKHGNQTEHQSDLLRRSNCGSDNKHVSEMKLVPGESPKDSESNDSGDKIQQKALGLTKPQKESKSTTSIEGKLENQKKRKHIESNITSNMHITGEKRVDISKKPKLEDTIKDGKLLNTDISGTKKIKEDNSQKICSSTPSIESTTFDQLLPSASCPPKKNNIWASFINRCESKTAVAFSEKSKLEIKPCSVDIGTKMSKSSDMKVVTEGKRKKSVDTRDNKITTTCEKKSSEEEKPKVHEADKNKTNDRNKAFRHKMRSKDESNSFKYSKGRKHETIKESSSLRSSKYSEAKKHSSSVSSDQDSTPSENQSKTSCKEGDSNFLPKKAESDPTMCASHTPSNCPSPEASESVCDDYSMSNIYPKDSKGKTLTSTVTVTVGTDSLKSSTQFSIRKDSTDLARPERSSIPDESLPVDLHENINMKSLDSSFDDQTTEVLKVTGKDCVHSVAPEPSTEEDADDPIRVEKLKPGITEPSCSDPYEYSQNKRDVLQDILTDLYVEDTIVSLQTPKHCIPKTVVDKIDKPEQAENNWEDHPQEVEKTTKEANAEVNPTDANSKSLQSTDIIDLASTKNDIKIPEESAVDTKSKITTERNNLASIRDEPFEDGEIADDNADDYDTSLEEQEHKLSPLYNAHNDDVIILDDQFEIKISSSDDDHETNFTNQKDTLSQSGASTPLQDERNELTMEIIDVNPTRKIQTGTAGETSPISEKSKSEKRKAVEDVDLSSVVDKEQLKNISGSQQRLTKRITKSPEVTITHFNEQIKNTSKKQKHRIRTKPQTELSRNPDAKINIDYVNDATTPNEAREKKNAAQGDDERTKTRSRNKRRREKRRSGEYNKRTVPWKLCGAEGRPESSCLKEQNVTDWDTLLKEHIQSMNKKKTKEVEGENLDKKIDDFLKNIEKRNERDASRGTFLPANQRFNTKPQPVRRNNYLIDVKSYTSTRKQDSIERCQEFDDDSIMDSITISSLCQIQSEPSTSKKRQRNIDSDSDSESDSKTTPVQQRAHSRLPRMNRDMAVRQRINPQTGRHQYLFLYEDVRSYIWVDSDDILKVNPHFYNSLQKCFVPEEETPEQSQLKKTLFDLVGLPMTMPP